jgi:hypothetical protein
MWQVAEKATMSYQATFREEAWLFFIVHPQMRISGEKGKIPNQALSFSTKSLTRDSPST